MLAGRSQDLCTVMLLLLIYILTCPTFAIPVTLMSTKRYSEAIGLEQEFDDSFEPTFQTCVCNSQSNECRTEVEQLAGPSEQTSPVLSSENAANYPVVGTFTCEYINKILYCAAGDARLCTDIPCTIHIIIKCSAYNVSLLWGSKEDLLVLANDRVTVIDCCTHSSTTREVATTTTTLHSTNFITRHATMLFATTTLMAGGSSGSVGFVQSTSSTLIMNYTQSGKSNQQQESNDASSQIPGQHIGVIVGTGIAAILFTILIVCILWKLKTRRKKHQRKERTKSAMSISDNLEMNHVHDLRHPTVGRNVKPLKTIAHVAQLVQSSDMDNQLAQTTGDYTYIDIYSTVSNKPNVTLTSPTPEVEENKKMATENEAVSAVQDNEYSHLGTIKISPENPYNWLDHENRSTSIQPGIIPASQKENHQLRHDLDTPCSRFTPTNHHVLHGTQQEIGADESSSLYSKLGVGK